MELAALLDPIVRIHQLDYCGVADFTPAVVQDFIRATSAPFTLGYPRAVAVGLRLCDALVDLLPDADERIRALYKHHVYTVTAGRIDVAAGAVVSVLQQEGHRALAVPAAIIGIDREHFAGIISQKLAPHLAGLGWIGKSCMLITPDHGPRVCWGTILTDAPLTPTGEPMTPRCGSCRVCAVACPAQAYTGRDFAPTEPREARFDAAACYRYVSSLPGTGPEVKTCGCCLQACPHGRSPASRVNRNQE